MLALSANGSKAGTGIVWAVVPLDGDANQQRGVKGIVLALDAQDVSRTLWTSEQFAQRDRLGLFAKFTPPVVAAGKVFVATYGDDEQRRTYPNQPAVHPTEFPKNYYVAVYGLLGVPAPERPVVNQDRDDVTVVRAATTPLVLDTTTCQPVDAASVDCTEALAQAASAPEFPSSHYRRWADGFGLLFAADHHGQQGDGACGCSRNRILERSGCWRKPDRGKFRPVRRERPAQGCRDCDASERRPSVLT